MTQKQQAIEIFLAGVESVKPKNLIKQYVSTDNDMLWINGASFDLTVKRNIYVIGFGKASAAMSQTLESILGSRITKGCVITKYGHSVPQRFIEIIEAGHPVPDKNGIRGTEHILSIVRNAGKDDLVICLISGGGSALLADVPEGCTLEDLKLLNNLLLNVGANITEINCIRKHLSKVKGGLLSKAAYPAMLISLIISDVIGDPLDVIASGPTTPDPTTFEDAIAILKKYNIEDKVPNLMYRTLLNGLKNKHKETLKASDEVLLRTKNIIIGTNVLALKAAKEKAESLGYSTQIITNSLDGDVVDVADYIIESVRTAKSNSCLLFAGEPTIKVTGTGLGGRNQHLALLIADLLKDMFGITILVAGTDGTDGPTDAAGAIVDSYTRKNVSEFNLDIKHYIRNNDAYHFFKREGGLIITGPTQTNVMDLIIALIQ
jgi:glycerate-2-kinase